MDGSAPLNARRLTLVVIFTALAVTSIVGPAAAAPEPSNALDGDGPVFQTDPGDSTDAGNESESETEDEGDEDTTDEEASNGNTATRTRMKRI